MSPSGRRYSCRYCDLQFDSEEECKFHEDKECNLNPNLLKDEKPLTFAGFIISSTMIVVGLALVILSPVVIYIILLSQFSSPLEYVALVLFWLLIFGVPTILATVVDYMRKKSRMRS
jgi:hypothetical protein